MTISEFEISVPSVVDVNITDDTLSVDLTDGRTIAVPLGWYPRLSNATSEERNHWRLIGRGDGIHWEDLDEDVSVVSLLAGKPSGESQNSFRTWMEGRSNFPIST